ncbi:MAG: GNAT family N-acetyltransferase [Candidatus Bathyarchaeota archaeon]|nr:GNAT family N-acetyltransferase [Candidatus Bathyarchaeota archaeon]
MESFKSKPKIHVRKARSTDHEAVFKFCEKTWSWGDYIPKVWDKWLKEKNDRVFVATIDDVPVGISHLSIDKPDEVWLSGARTDPKYRRRGVATAITKKCLEYARKKGAKVARLVTESDNIAARTLLQKLGFKQVAEFVEMKMEKITEEKSNNSRWIEENETEVSWVSLQNSRVYHKSAGLYTVLFHWFSLEKRDLERFIKQRKAILHMNDEGKIDGLTLTEDATSSEWCKNSIQTSYIDGDYEAVLDMIKFLKGYCSAAKIKRIYGFTCNYKPIITALERLGFEPPETTEIVYEKSI